MNGRQTLRVSSNRRGSVFPDSTRRMPRFSKLVSPTSSFLGSHSSTVDSYTTELLPRHRPRNRYPDLSKGNLFTSTWQEFPKERTSWIDLLKPRKQSPNSSRSSSHPPIPPTSLLRSESSTMVESTSQSLEQFWISRERSQLDITTIKVGIKFNKARTAE